MKFKVYRYIFESDLGVRAAKSIDISPEYSLEELLKLLKKNYSDQKEVDDIVCNVIEFGHDVRRNGIVITMVRKCAF